MAPKTQSSTSTRKILNTRSSTPRIDTSRKANPLSAPAGRSPTRKRIGILNRRKTAGPVFGRVEPPRFGGLSGNEGGLGFSIDAALSGTIPSYSSRQSSSTSSAINVDVNDAKPEGLDMSAIPILHQETTKESWFFHIHEDTEEELATNLMEHSTCILDISSDEESRVRERDFRGKENVAPADDVSQTRVQLTSSSSNGMGGVDATEMQMNELKARVRAGRERGSEIEIDREPLGMLAARDFYPEGCDEESVFLLPSEEPSDENTLPSEEVENTLSPPFEENLLSSDQELNAIPLSSEVEVDFEISKGKEIDLGLEDVRVEQEERVDVDYLMCRDENAPKKAALLQPLEKAEEGWVLWESGSVDGE